MQLDSIIVKLEPKFKHFDVSKRKKNSYDVAQPLFLTSELLPCQIAKLSMIPVSCFLEIVFDNMRYSRDTKLSIMLVLLGVAICTVSDVSVNAKGFIAASIAVWSTALQQYVSCLWLDQYLLLKNVHAKIKFVPVNRGIKCCQSSTISWAYAL